MGRSERPSREEVESKLEELSALLESLEWLNSGKETKGLFLMRFFEDGDKVMTAIGNICPHCLQQAALFLEQEKSGSLTKAVFRLRRALDESLERRYIA